MGTKPRGSRSRSRRCGSKVAFAATRLEVPPYVEGWVDSGGEAVAQAVAYCPVQSSPGPYHMSVRRAVPLALAVICLGAFAGATSETEFTVPQWAFPIAVPLVDHYPTADSVTKHRIPRSTRQFTQKEAYNRFAPVDWFPDASRKAPPIVAEGRRPTNFSCGFCHMLDGEGRPENATLAGLSAPYIARQLRAFRDQTRLSSNPRSKTNSMHNVAKGLTDEEIEAAATYYATRRTRRPNRVIESTTVPKHRLENVILVRDGTGTEPLDGRLIEMPDDTERHELHDPSVRYTTWVPMGALARGQRLVTGGIAGPTTACATCHGPSLLGVGDVPPIAGRSPSYVLRQLINFKTGARNDAIGLLMKPVVTPMELDDMVAIAAYVGSLPPSAPPPARE